MLQDILLLLAGLLVGAVAGFFIARTVMQKYLKKNPPISEDMIKTLMMQMGRKPNQKQINQMMKAMQKYQ
ncbi:MAG: YneF family protein [Bacilli bacterium]|nr:YneF family protein [Bacilli bacterium]